MENAVISLLQLQQQQKHFGSSCCTTTATSSTSRYGHTPPLLPLSLLHSLGFCRCRNVCLVVQGQEKNLWHLVLLLERKSTGKLVCSIRCSLWSCFNLSERWEVGKERGGRVLLRALDEGDGGLLVDLYAGVHGGEEGGEVLHRGPLVPGQPRRLTVFPAQPGFIKTFSQQYFPKIFTNYIFQKLLADLWRGVDWREPDLWRGSEMGEVLKLHPLALSSSRQSVEL